jgi:hypothetical protein
VFSLAMVRDVDRRERVASAGQGALTAAACGCGWRQVLYYMWTGRHPLDEYTRHFTIIREIGKGTRCVRPRPEL